MMISVSPFCCVYDCANKQYVVNFLILLFTQTGLLVKNACGLSGHPGVTVRFAYSVSHVP